MQFVEELDYQRGGQEPSVSEWQNVCVREASEASVGLGCLFFFSFMLTPLFFYMYTFTFTLKEEINGIVCQIPGGFGKIN